MAPGGIEIWLIMFIALLLVGPLVLAGVFTLLARRASRNPRPPAGWFADPSGSHQLRYWDGNRWTDNVRNGEIASTHRFPRKAPAPSASMPTSGVEAVREQPEIPGAPAMPALPKPSGFWTKGRIIAAVSLLAAALLVPFAIAGFGLWQFTAQESEKMETMRGFVDEAYPDYEIVDSTRSGYILQHKEHGALRLDVRFFKDEPVWEQLPKERVNDEWFTHETFFRHAEGLPQDPLWPMNYDIEGFVKAYQRVRPGPNSVISAVWLEDPWDGVEKYVVMAARRNRTSNGVEPMFPDHIAYFTRDCATGEWTAYDFKSIDDPGAWDPPYLEAIYGEYGDPDEAARVAHGFLDKLVRQGDVADAFGDTDPATWEGGTQAEFEAMVVASPGFGEVTALQLVGYKDTDKNPKLAQGDFEIFLEGTAGDRTIYYRVKMRQSEQGWYQPCLLTIQEKPFPPVANMWRF